MSKPKVSRLQVLQDNQIKEGFDPKGSTSETSADHIIAELYPRQSIVLKAMFKKAAEDPKYAGALELKFALVTSPDHVDYEG